MTKCSCNLWTTIFTNDDTMQLYAMITKVNQLSSVRFDNKLLRKSLHNETNFNICEFTGKR